MSDTCKPIREPLVTNAFSCWENSLEKLETEFASLFSRIDPILSVAEPKEAPQEGKCGSNCRMAGEIISFTDRINGLSERVVDMLNRVEI